MIRKTKSGKYEVVSEDGSRSFGTYSSRQEAEKRLRQVEYFKSRDKSKGYDSKKRTS